MPNNGEKMPFLAINSFFGAPVVSGGAPYHILMVVDRTKRLLQVLGASYQVLWSPHNQKTAFLRKRNIHGLSYTNIVIRNLVVTVIFVAHGRF